MFEFDFSQSEVNPSTAGRGPGHEADRADACGGPASPEPLAELLPGVDVSNMTVPEFLAASRPAPERLPASTFAHLSDPDDLGRALFEAQGRYSPCDLEFQALIFEAIGTFHGDLVAEKLAPTPNVPEPKAPPMPRKRQPKGWKPPMTNLIALAAVADGGDENA